MKGRIVKGIAGFYYVYIEEMGLYECKAKGVFRKEHLKPLVGDYAEVDVLSEEPKCGNITEIYPRRNSLIRPEVANIDQALIVFALKKPNPNFLVLDKLLLQYRIQNIPVILCFNKEDIVDKEYVDNVRDAYSNCGCDVVVTNAKDILTLADLRKMLDGKTTSVSGPSGVGKSSIINALSGEDRQETGSISRKLERGKNTTRHSEIVRIGTDSFIMDTPGFTSYDVSGIEYDDLEKYYPEFDEFRHCYYVPCSHIHEPNCGVKEAVENGRISQVRYDNYIQIYNEIKSRRRF